MKNTLRDIAFVLIALLITAALVAGVFASPAIG